MPTLRRKRTPTPKLRRAAAAAARAKVRGSAKSKTGADGGRAGDGSPGAQSKRDRIARLSSLGGAADLAVLAADDSGVIKLRMIIRVVTYVANMLLELVAMIAAKRRAKARVEDLSVEMASQALAKGGVSDGLVSHTLVHDCKTGHAFEVWEVGRWGHDDSRMEVLGRGATLGVAVHEWLRGQKTTVRRRFTSPTAR